MVYMRWSMRNLSRYTGCLFLVGSCLFTINQWPGFSMERRIAADQEAYDCEAAANREYTGFLLGRNLDDSGKPASGFVDTVLARSLTPIETRQ